MSMKPPSPNPAAGPELWEALARYAAGESSPDEARTLERWLAEEPSRQALLAALDRSLGGLTASPTPGLDVEAALERVRARMEEPDILPISAGPGLTKERPRASRRTILRMAASVILLLGGVLVWQRIRVPSAAPAQTFATGVGETDTVRLADGTSVRLGPESRLTVIEAYGGTAREVELSGEAMFQVAHDEARPFTVRAGGAVVTDLGTAFTVRTDGDEGVRVVVTEGSVRLAPAGAAAGQGVVLAAGERGVLGPSGMPALEPGSPTDADLAWTEGRLVFDDAPFARVAADLRRWYGVELVLADSSLAGRRLTASFAGEAPEQVLDVIALALGAEVELEEGRAVLRASAGEAQ